MWDNKYRMCIDCYEVLEALKKGKNVDKLLGDTNSMSSSEVAHTKQLMQADSNIQNVLTNYGGIKVQQPTQASEDYTVKMDKEQFEKFLAFQAQMEAKNAAA